MNFALATYVGKLTKYHSKLLSIKDAMDCMNVPPEVNKTDHQDYLSFLNTLLIDIEYDLEVLKSEFQ